MHGEFSTWFKEAVEGHGASGDVRNRRPKRQRGERYFFRTGVWNGDVAFAVELGQYVWIEVKNVNTLGTTITIDSDRDGSRSMILLPFISHTFKFYALVEDPLVWGFQVSTISDAFVVQYAIYSDWVPNLPE